MLPEDILVRRLLRRLVLADLLRADTSYEREGRYINAPDWPWLMAGSIVAVFFLVFALVAYHVS